MHVLVPNNLQAGYLDYLHSYAHAECSVESESKELAAINGASLNNLEQLGDPRVLNNTFIAIAN